MKTKKPNAKKVCRKNKNYLENKPFRKQII